MSLGSAALIAEAPTAVSVENAVIRPVQVTDQDRKNHPSGDGFSGKHSQRQAQCAFSLRWAKTTSFNGRQMPRTSSSSFGYQCYWDDLSQVNCWISPAIA